MSRSLTIRCPGCGDAVEVDSSSGKVLSHRKKGAADAPADLLAMAREVERKRQEAPNDFGSTLQDLERRKKKAESLFDEARRKAQDELDRHGGVPPKEEDGW